jgi:hypothetical protein
MGIRPEQITDAMIKGDASGVLRSMRDQAIGNTKSLTSRPAETGLLEREEQAKLATWLNDQKRLGCLQYDWSATHKKVTRRIGMPDFAIWRNSHSLLGEMKLPGAKCSPEQARVHAEFWRSGTPVHIWYSAAEATGCIEAWLRSI